MVRNTHVLEDYSKNKVQKYLAIYDVTLCLKNKSIQMHCDGSTKIYLKNITALHKVLKLQGRSALCVRDDVTFFYLTKHQIIYTQVFLTDHTPDQAQSGH